MTFNFKIVNNILNKEKVVIVFFSLT